MRKTQHALLAVAVLSVLAAALAWVGTRQLPVLRQGSAWLEDLQLAYFSQPRPQSESVILLTIDENTLAGLPFRSPISRAFLARVLRDLAEKKPSALGIDILFDQPTIAEDDTALLEAIDSFPAPVVAVVGDASTGLTQRQVAFQDSYLEGRLVGSATLHTTDGVVREVFPGDNTAAGFTPGLVAAMAGALDVELAEPQRIYYRVRREGEPPPIRAFPATTVEHLPASWIEGRAVLLGADLPNQDRFRTPLSVLGGTSSTMSGVEIHAQALSQLLENERYPAAPAWVEALVLLAAAVIGCALPFTSLSLPLKTTLGVACVVGYSVLGFSWFAEGGAQLPLLGPVAAFCLAASFGVAYARHEDRAEKRFVREAFQRYVSPAVIEHVLSDPGKLVLGGEKREMSFLFSDLAGFTSLTEEQTPETIVSLLQQYFEGMLKIALEHGGTVDRLVGDSIAVFFNAPANQPDHAQRAVRCALAVDRFCEAFRAERLSAGLRLGVTRIGVHTGTAIAGNVGSTVRFHYTAHGDAVNTAARLESVNKHLGTRVCISTDAARHCPEERLRMVGELVLKGKTKGLRCVAPIEEGLESVVEEYLEAYVALEQEDPVASELFAALHRKFPNDPLIAFHSRRLSKGERGSRIVLEEK
jgi:class 3 adenylate cyclase/CHASE2 domain-containing sensor protein